MGVKVTNNAYGTLSAGIASGDTTITLDGGQGARFPTLGAGDYFYATLVDTANNIEVVKVTARSSDSMTVVRGQDNTVAKAYAIGDRCELRPTAALFNDIQTAIDNVDLSSRVAKTGDDMSGDLRIGTSFGTTNPTTTASNIKKLDFDETYHDGTAGDASFSKLSLYSLSASDTYGMGVSSSSFNIFTPSNFRIFASSANPKVERFRIDASGRVYLPSQPFFFAAHGASEAPSAGSAFTQWSVKVNNGGGSFSSGVYTVPADGFYFVDASLLLASGATGAGGYKIRQNTTYLYRVAYCTNGAGYQMASGACVLQCGSGDTIAVTQENTGIDWYGDSPGLGNFTIVKVG